MKARGPKPAGDVATERRTCPRCGRNFVTRRGIPPHKAEHRGRYGWCVRVAGGF